MAKAYKSRDIKIIIDGIELADVSDVSINRETETMGGPFLDSYNVYQSAPGRTRIELHTIHNTDLAFDVYDKTLVSNDSYKVVNDEDATTLYIYGPFRQLFPSLFADRDLLDWQLDFLVAFKYPEYAKYKYYRNDAIFDTLKANYFQLGFEYGKKRGEENGQRDGYSRGRKDKMQDQEDAKERQQSRKRKQW